METRSREQLLRHYEVERELADRLRASTREERAHLFATLYQELFDRVPDHPRLTRIETEEDRKRLMQRQWRLLEPLLTPQMSFLEIAPGDCLLSYEAARHVSRSFAADISDQRGPHLPPAPENFSFVVYDGYELPLEANSIDAAFSYQFLEHLHPDDVRPHLELILRVLKPGGFYLLSTPHCFTGPHDISRHFSDVPRGFHLKEWTHFELFAFMRELGFSECLPVRQGKPVTGGLMRGVLLGLERAISVLPRGLQKVLGNKLFQNVVLLARK
jgi:SAM-dependent methyltransferase